MMTPEKPGSKRPSPFKIKGCGHDNTIQPLTDHGKKNFRLLAYTTTYYIFFLIQTMLIEIYIVLNQLTTTHVFADIPRYKGFRKPMQIPLKTALSEAIYFGN